MLSQPKPRKDPYHLPKEQATLTEKDHDLLRTFSTLCKIDGLLEFTSDDFRMYGLDRFIADKAHGIGGLFAKWKVNGKIEETGVWRRSMLPSNHGRMNRVYRWNTQ
jgi:hypothetical protein